MNGFARAFAASTFVLFSSAVFGQSYQQNSIVAEYAIENVSVVSESGHTNTISELSYPGASFVKVHFENFRPPPGMTIEVRNPESSESYLYSREFKDAYTFDSDLGDDGATSFYSMSISGDTAIIEVHSKHGSVRSAEKSARGRVFVDHVVRGLPTEIQASTTQAKKSKSDASVESIGSGSAGTESTCGQMERFDAVCWAGSDPVAYDRAVPVARILVGASGCTAWRVGAGNHMFTNNHCIARQTEASATEVWFNYERSVCGGDGTETIVKVAADQLISTDYTLDYTLFSVKNFASIQSFGNLGLEVREATLGEAIYIPQYGDGDPKQIAIDSDMNVGGICQVDDDDVYGRNSGTDIGYFCDTSGGSSGSPVVLANSQKAIALHHYGGCLNSGVKMSLIWKKVSRYFGRTVPEGDFDPDNLRTPVDPSQQPDPDPIPDPDPDLPPLAAFSFVCSYLECEFDGSGSSDTEGPVTAFQWNFGDESTAEGVSVGHAFPASGSYNVSLMVSDSGGYSDTASRTVTVSAAPVQNEAPEARFSFSCSDLSCNFNASDSSDPDGSITGFSWSFGDGKSGIGLSNQHSFEAEGIYSVTLSVTDNQGSTSTVSQDVTVQQVSMPVPTIELSVVGVKNKGNKWADLSWQGAESSQVRIIRDNFVLAVAENSGNYRDESVSKSTKSATYRVCSLDESSCSDEVKVSF